MLTTLTTYEDYLFVQSRGFEPLLDPHFPMTIELRKEVQQKLFGSGHTPAENEKFYRWCWQHRQHICEETMISLHEYSAVYISHILSRGAHPEMAHDPRNINILCARAHAQWENGDRRSMRIYERNQRTIQKLKEEYYGLQGNREEAIR